MRPRTADYEMKPMLGDETEAGIPGVSFAAHDDARQTPRAGVEGGRPDSGLFYALVRTPAGETPLKLLKISLTQQNWPQEFPLRFRRQA